MSFFDRKITRRTMLKGLLGGAVVSIALPPLEAFMNLSGTAYADNTPFPTRFGIWYWGNGGIPADFVPTTEGADWMPSPILTPLMSMKQKITVVSGLRLNTTNTVPHGSGPAGLLTGADQQNGTVISETFDQTMANKVGGQTRFGSLEIGVQRATSSISYTGPNQVNPPETSPAALFNRLFVEGFRLPGDMSMPDPTIGLRKSVLDAVTAESARLGQRLGAADKARLDQHLTGIRSLEMQLQKLQEAPPSLAACARPAMPGDDTEYADIDGRAQLSKISRVMSDMMAMALACDQTRVFTNMFTQPVSNVLFPGADAGHHQLTHDEPDPQTEVENILTQIMTELEYFLEALDKVPEGDGTLLDHCAILATTDCSLGRTHSLDDYPILLAGSANGQLQTGIHYRSKTNENLCKLSLTLLRIMGVTASSFGVGPGLTTDELTVIRT